MACDVCFIHVQLTVSGEDFKPLFHRISTPGALEPLSRTKFQTDFGPLLQSYSRIEKRPSKQFHAKKLNTSMKTPGISG